MIKFNKKFVLSLLFVAILVPTAVSAKVYFMARDDEDNIKNPVVRPCESRGFNIIPKKHCSKPEVGSGDLPGRLADKCTNPSGVGTTETLHRRCACTEDYKYTEDQCRGWNQDPIGISCQAQNPSPLYQTCGCNLGKFPYKADSSNCPAETQVGGEKVVTQRVVADGACNTGPQGQNGDLFYAECACPQLEYKKTCGSPMVGKGYSCNNRYKECVCDRTIYSKTCDQHGSKPQYRCIDDNGTYYSTCNDELPQVKIYVVDGYFDEPLKTSCSDKKQAKGLKDVKVTFSKQGEAEVVAYTDATGTISIPVPYDIDKRPVSVKLEKQLDDKYDGSADTDAEYITLSDTCNYDGVNTGTYYCDGMLYPLSPKKLPDGNQDFVRIITTWGSMSWVGTTMSSYNIRDLDTHMLKDSSAFIWYGGKESGGMRLDVDDTACFGPETITFKTSDIGNNPYYFSAIIFGDTPANNDTLKRGMVMTYVYVNGELKRIFKSAQANQTSDRGTVWNVFRLSKSGNAVKIDGTGGSNHGIIRDIGTGSGGLNSTSSRSLHGW